MGICSSCQLEPQTPTTAKVIHQDGRLQEFDQPVKVSQVINPKETFICNSDEMDFGDVASPVSAKSELQLGQLYFALPVSKLSQPLPAEEMAALAVKAHAALMRNGGVGVGDRRKKCCRCKKSSNKTAPVFYVGAAEWEKDGGKLIVVGEESLVVGGRRQGMMAGKKSGGGGGRGGINGKVRSRPKVFAAHLTTIQE